MKKSNSDPSRQEIWKMFDQISPTYDRVNRVMTGGFDRYWRKKMHHFLPDNSSISLLDCATGTGDQILSLMSHSKKIDKAIGIDLSKEMLSIAREKIKKRRMDAVVSFEQASLLELPFAQDAFDCVTISFGIRNVTDVPLALQECRRVLKSGGRLLILEGSVPQNPLLKPFFLFYLRHVLPRIGALISKNKQAYRYLNETIETFPCGENFCNLLREAGFTNAKAHPLMAGSVTIYTGDK